KGREVRRSRQGTLKGSGIEGQGWRSRLERPGQLRQAVRRRHDEDAEGQIHAATRADAIRLACDPGRRRASRQGTVVRRGEAAIAAAAAGAVARQVLQGSPVEGRGLIPRAKRMSGV